MRWFLGPPIWNCILLQASATPRLRCQFATSSLRHKIRHAEVSARVTSPCQPENLICRSCSYPTWLQRWCQRTPGFRHQAWWWIHRFIAIEILSSMWISDLEWQQVKLSIQIITAHTCLTDTSRLPFASDNPKNVEIKGLCLGRGSYIREFCSICCAEPISCLDLNQLTEFTAQGQGWADKDFGFVQMFHAPNLALTLLSTH